MKICPVCGKKFEGEFCPGCGAAAKEETPSPRGENTPVTSDETYAPGTGYAVSRGAKPGEVKRTNPFAVMGLLLSFVPLLGLILSVLGIAKSKEYRNTGKPAAVAGIIISSGFIALYAIVSFLLV